MHATQSTTSTTSPPPGGRPERTVVRPFAVADRGMAMAHIRGKVAFVPYAAPGDRVEVEVVRERRRYVQTRLVRVIEPSPLRRPARCPHFGACGGCQWQHLPYPVQVRAKDRSFRGFVRTRLGAEPTFRDPAPSPAEWGYRNRVAWKVRWFHGRANVGYFRAGSHRLVPLQACPVARPELEALLEPLAAFLQGFGPARGGLPQVDLQVDGEGRLWAVVHLLVPPSPADARQLAAFFRETGVRGALVQAGRKHTLRSLDGDPGPMVFPLEAQGERFRLAVTPGGFVQANLEVNRILVEEVIRLEDLYRGGTALDLYAGAGNFTLPLARAASRVVAVEGYPPAARDAARNAERHAMDHVEVLARPVERALEDLIGARLRPDFALLDPPREGARPALEALAALAPKHVLYISCSAPALVRDLRVLVRTGYRILWIRTADMFPQTAHLESITLLERAF